LEVVVGARRVLLQPRNYAISITPTYIKVQNLPLGSVKVTTRV
jgi:hypothetical protein